MSINYRIKYIYLLKQPYECFYVFRIIISCVFVYLDSIKVSHSFYDAKIEITSIAYIIFS